MTASKFGILYRMRYGIAHEIISKRSLIISVFLYGERLEVHNETGERLMVSGGRLARLEYTLQAKMMATSEDGRFSVSATRGTVANKSEVRFRSTTDRVVRRMARYDSVGDIQADCKSLTLRAIGYMIGAAPIQRIAQFVAENA